MPNIFSNQLAGSQPLATRLLSAAWLNQKLLPAYLLIGRALPDKWRVAKQLAGHLNCSRTVAADSKACLSQGQADQSNWCVNCRWVDADEHPQALKVLSGEGSKSGKIAVEKARELAEELAKASRYYRVIVVEDASQEIFHRPAANALLKTIEEPNPGILLFFFAHSSEEVLPTVVSRCQMLNVVGAAPEGIWSISGADRRPDHLAQSTLDEIERILEETRKARGKKSLLKSIDLAESLQELLADEQANFDELVDAVVALELKSLGERLGDSRRLTSYAKGLINIGELAKSQNRQFVSKKPVIESLTFSWGKLRVEHKC